jgi:hypothetical protein
LTAGLTARWTSARTTGRQQLDIALTKCCFAYLKPAAALTVDGRFDCQLDICKDYKETALE